MVDSLKIKNHKEHLNKLLKNAESDRPEAIKDLVDYIMLYKGSSFSDIILRKGIALVSNNAEFINLDSKSKFSCV